MLFSQSSDNIYLDQPFFDKFKINGDLIRIVDNLTQLKKLTNSNEFELKVSNSVEVSAKSYLSSEAEDIIKNLIVKLIPWRKGPFTILNYHIDSEWQSQMKWNRLKTYLKPMNNKTILDIGCSNGYYMFQMSKFNPKFVLGVEPMQKYWLQFELVNSLAQKQNLQLLPITFEKLSESLKFDSIFSMGVLYHRRNPLEHLKKIFSHLSAGGQLVLESLISLEEEDIIPKSRYAKMKNVWLVPTIKTIKSLLTKSGFVNIECVSIEPTTTFEQRRTSWSLKESLEDFLMADKTKTIEGYQIPVRAIITADKS